MIFGILVLQMFLDNTSQAEHKTSQELNDVLDQISRVLTAKENEMGSSIYFSPVNSSFP